MAAVADCQMGLAVGSPFISILSSLRAHHPGGCNVMAWWLQHPLFTDMAGNILVLSAYSTVPQAVQGSRLVEEDKDKEVCGQS